MENTTQFLKSLYNLSYFDKFGGSIIFTVIVAIMVIGFIMYGYIKANMRSLRKDWAAIRCSPQYLPFAGMIAPNRSKDVSAFTETGQNFAYCSGMILETITDDFTRPIVYLIHTIHETIKGIKNDVNNVRKKFKDIIGNIEEFVKEVVGKIMNGTMPIRYIIIKMKDMIAKTVGVLLMNVYAAESTTLAFKSFITSFINIMIEGLIALVAMIIPLIALIFTAPLAAPLLVAFGVISVFLIATMNTLVKPLKLKVIGSPPSKPSPPPPPKFKFPFSFCFGENTPIVLLNDNIVSIKDVKVGDILKYDGEVTSVLKLAYSKEHGHMYNVDGIIVSGSHSKYVNYTWKYVNELEYPKLSSLSSKHTKYIYCLNTMSKKIHIEGISKQMHIFSDWDDVDVNEHMKMCEKIGVSTDTFSQSEYHKNLENGMSGQILVRLPNNTLKEVREIEIGDMLEGNNEVIGKVVILGDLPLYHYKFGNGTKNLCIRNKYFSPVKMGNSESHLYHLETKKGFFKTYDDTVIMNYRYGIERLL
jgi:hypothetical protein